MTCYYGIRSHATGVVRAKNNLVQPLPGRTGFEGFFHAASDYNASSDFTTTGGVNDRIGLAFDFVDPSNGDFHLSPTDTAAQDVGADLSADIDLPFSDDVDAQTRVGSWDVGSDEVMNPPPG